MRLRFDHRFRPDEATGRQLAQILNEIDVLKEQGATIMSAISDYAAAASAFHARMDAAVGALTSSVAGVSADVTALKAKIEELQNSPGGITPEDQALLDEAQTMASGLAERAEAVASALAALDALTP